MGRRAAQMWKNQEQLTDLGIVNEGLPIEDQLRVKIALRMMRKAHTKTARSEAERRQRKLGFEVHSVEHIGAPTTSSMQEDTVQIRSLDEIMKEARNNFALTKDKRKMDKDSTKYGQLRPIYTTLVEEIFAEQAEKQRVIDEREENEVESLVSDGAGGRMHRPSHISAAKKRKSMQRPHSAAALGAHRRTIQGNHGMTGSHEAPAKLQGDRATFLGRASQANTDPVTGQPANRRQELVPIKSVEVLAMNNLEAELSGQAHGRISRTQKELLNHVKNGQQLQSDHQHLQQQHQQHGGKHSATKAGTKGRPSLVSAMKPSTGEGKHAAPSFAAGPSSGKFRTAPPSEKRSSPTEVTFAPSTGLPVVPEEDTAVATFVYPDIEPSQVAANLVWMMRLGKAAQTLERAELKRDLLLPSQMVLQAQKSGYGDFDRDENLGVGASVKSFVALREQASSKRSSFFSSSAVREDEKISRAQSQRDEILKVREDEIKQRILKKELSMQSRADQVQKDHRQRAWAIAIVSLARWSILSDIVIKYRAQHEKWEDANATKKAIALIEKWWRRGRRRSANLIVMFLQDSTGMSETMRAIYAFRHTVIRLQRWIRSWIDVQHCRMRILWMKGERMYREKLKLERGNEKVEVIPQRALFASNYFTDTVDEMAHKRKALGRLLEDQEQARALRQEEARLAEENNQRRKAAEEARRRRIRAIKQAKAVTESMKVSSFTAAAPTKREPVKKHIIPWHIRIRSSAANIQTYDLLREILRNERRRHILNLVQHHRVGDECPIGAYELRKYLKNPYGYDGAAEISRKLAEAQIVTRSPADIYRTSPFLLLTMGGLDALDLLLRTNRFVKF